MKEEKKKLHEEIEQLRKEIAELRAGQTPQPIWMWYSPPYPYPYIYLTLKTGTEDYNFLNNNHTVTGVTKF